jgi:predicted Zn-dependent protease
MTAFLAGCAAVPPTPPEVAWAPDSNWWAAAIQVGGRVPRKDGSSFRVNAERSRNLYEVARKIREQSTVDAQIALIDNGDLNAYSSEVDGVRQIVLTLSLLEAIGGDRDALATTIGHEAAHLHYAHVAARNARNRLATGDSAAVAGIVAVNTSFTRYEEREADIKGMEWAVAAGFSACGSARTMRLISARHTHAGDHASLSNHPDFGERIARANELSTRLDGRGC